MERSVQAFKVSSEEEIQEFLERIKDALQGRLLPPRSERLRYLDTFDWRIHRSGAQLTETRTRGDLILRLSANGDEPVFAATPRSPHFADDLPLGPVLERLESVVAPRRLLPVAEIARKMTTIELLDVERKIVARVTAVSSEFASVENAAPSHKLILEGVRGYDDEYQAVYRYLCYQLGLTVAKETDVEEVFELLGSEAGTDPSALRLDISPQTPAGDAVRLGLAGLWDIIAKNREGVLANLDTEFLHDFRVSVRRTRSILDQLGDLLPAAAVEHYSQEFRWLSQVTDASRDLDVLLLNLPLYRQHLPDDNAVGMEGIRKTVQADRDKAQKSLRKALKGDRFRKLESTWKPFLIPEETKLTRALPGDAGKPIGSVARERAWKRYRKIRRGGLQFDSETPAKKLHTLRIRCKKLRYLLEVFRGIYREKAFAACLKPLKRLQSTLGEVNDTQVHTEMLGKLASRIGDEHEDSRQTLVAIGIVIARLAQRREVERSKFFDRFQTFADQKTLARFEKLLKRGKR